MNRPSSMSSTRCSCLAAAYRSARRSTSGTPKYSSAARAPASRGIPAITCWYTAGVKRCGVQLVWPRMSRHSPSISSWRASRQASSCGESTRTPSTSKIAPRYAMQPHRPSASPARGRRRRRRPAGPGPGPQRMWRPHPRCPADPLSCVHSAFLASEPSGKYFDADTARSASAAVVTIGATISRDPGVQHQLDERFVIVGNLTDASAGRDCARRVMSRPDARGRGRRARVLGRAARGVPYCASSRNGGTSRRSCSWLYRRAAPRSAAGRPVEVTAAARSRDLPANASSPG